MIRRAILSKPANAARALRVTPTRAIHATPASLANKTPGATTSTTDDAAPAAATDKNGNRGILGSIIYGSKELQKDQDVRLEQGQHSQLVGRGKYVHEKITHTVHPGQRDEYVKAAEAYFTTLQKESANLGNVKLCGSWETIIGAVGNFTHILEYEGYAGYDETRRKSLKNEALQALQNKMTPHLDSRQHQIIQEFSFMPSSPPRDSGFPDGGIFEMRTYQLQPGKLLEWEHAWKKGIDARQRFIKPVGAYFAQVGRLHEVHHLWQFPDMAARKVTRQQAWTVGSWSDTVQKTVSLTQEMKTTIMVPTSWSPLR